MDFKALEIELTKAAAWMLFAEALAFVIGMLILYVVIKSAIRDGINESKLVARAWNEGPRDPMQRDAVRATREAAKEMPPMRAD